MINDVIANQGGWLFRWRSYILLGFTPLIALVILQPEPIHTHFGETADTIYEAICIVIAFIGLGIRGLTVGVVPAGTSGRNTHAQRANSLNTTGMYSLTRNPLYFGNSIIYVAVAMFTQSLWLTILMILFLIVYLERIIATEERYLLDKFGEPYAQWAASVPVFFPRLHGWVPPELGFSIKNVLKREYSGFFGIVATLFIIDTIQEYVTENQTSIDQTWLIAFMVSAAIYLGLRALKKHTSLLKVEGR